MPTPDKRPGRQRALFLMLALCVGVLIIYPRQGGEAWFDPGDRGRDVYAFERTLHGELPYKDYFWFYGPLMPYVYAGFLGVLGCQISSVILCKSCLTLLAAAFLYLAVSELCAPLTAFFACAWFLVFYPDFFFTYNHIGGVAMIMAVLWTLFAYIRTARLSHAFLGLLWCFLLALIKVNFGVVATGMCVLGVFLTDRIKEIPRRKGRALFYASAFVIIPVLTMVVYGGLLKGLAPMEIRECLPYWSNDEPNVVNPLGALKMLGQFVLAKVCADETRACVAVIILGAAVRTAWLLVARKIEPGRRRELIAALILLGIFYAANLHEYLRSGVGYRRFWSLPLGMALSFVVVDTALNNAGKTVRVLAGIVAILLMGLSFGDELQYIRARNTPDHFLSCRRARIHVGNAREWVQTVEAATAYLQHALKPGEMFFALPYDSLYYYLAERKSPTRQLIFFAHTKIPAWQERSILKEIETNHVNYILLANICKSREVQFGILGQTYCPVISRYIEANFVPVARYGDWTSEPKSYENHGVMILRRQRPIGEGSASQIEAVTSIPATPLSLPLPAGP
jgi:ABC-type amino acid transport system permease subunit